MRMARRDPVCGATQVMSVMQDNCLMPSGPRVAIRQRRRLVGLMGAIIAGNVLVWLAALLAFRGQNILLTTALMAYLFGLRHALDADHIAAIDNVTRRLVAQKERPLTVGLFFSLGHSTVVVFLSALVAAGFMNARQSFPALQSAGTFWGTGVSAIFLLGIALANLWGLRQMISALSDASHPHDASAHSAPVGPLSRLLRPLLNGVKKGWHMYPVGFLFGMSFDTATEIGVLGIAAAAAVNRMPIWFIMVFPVLFTVGMTLIDTADGILMCQAYGWAMIHPSRKAVYTLTMTSLSIVLALGVSALELLNMVRSQWHLHGWLWRLIQSANGAGGWERLGLLAVVLLAVSFAAAWVINTRSDRRLASSTVG